MPRITVEVPTDLLIWAGMKALENAEVRGECLLQEYYKENLDSEKKPEENIIFRPQLSSPKSSLHRTKARLFSKIHTWKRRIFTSSKPLLVTRPTCTSPPLSTCSSVSHTRCSSTLIDETPEPLTPSLPAENSCIIPFDPSIYVEPRRTHKLATYPFDPNTLSAWDNFWTPTVHSLGKTISNITMSHEERGQAAPTKAGPSTGEPAATYNF